MRMIFSLILTTVCFALAATNAQAQLLALPGWQAQLGSNSSVEIAGTVTIVDQFTLLFEDFTYNGAGAGETDIVLVPFNPRPLNALDRFNALQSFFFFETAGSVTVLDDLRGANPEPGLPPAGGDSPAIGDEFGGENFTITIDRSNFGPGTPGDAAFNDFVAGGGTLGFSTISVFCHPQNFDFGSGIFLPPAPNADFNNTGLVDGQDFLAWQRNFGTAGIQVPGDANLDSVVDGMDLAVFESQFGTLQEVPGPLPPSFDELFPNFPNSLSASTIGVPEPSGWVLAFLAGVMLPVRLRNSRR